MSEKNEANTAAKIMYWVLLVASLPLLVIFFVYINNPDSPALHSIANITRELPANSSSKSPLLSKVMDVYCKSAPFFGLVCFLLSRKHLKTKENKAISYLMTLAFLYSIFYFIFIHSFLFSPYELTTGGKLLRLMSLNDYFLTFFYISLYAGIYSFTYLYFLVLFGTYLAVKERR
uniref:colicin immunity protein Cui n=1 Tax=Yersinia frederiksenii TaxID=29484 RepID=UPI001F4BE873|nr:colicin immunity protein Cui [Yersinia frederiksenii]ULG19814.1 colicin immunity protein [Yersinia frederiksenii]